MTIHLIARKWYIILLCAFLCSGGLYFEKSQTHDIVPQTGDMTYIRVVQFNTVPVFTTNQTSYEINMTDLAKSWSSLDELEMQLNSNYEMSKMSVDWDTMSESQKVKWLEEHFRVQHMGPGLYELIIQFTKKDAKDSQYIKDNNVELMDEYANFFSKTAAMVTTDTNLTTVKEYQHSSLQLLSRLLIAPSQCLQGLEQCA